jgi:hypothetical protein
MRMGCFATLWLGRPFCGCKQWDIEGDGRTGLDWMGRKEMCYYRFQSAWSFNGEREEDRKSKRFCFLCYVGVLNVMCSML